MSACNEAVAEPQKVSGFEGGVVYLRGCSMLTWILFLGRGLVFQTTDSTTEAE
jgi:hypothetical protein